MLELKDYSVTAFSDSYSANHIPWFLCFETISSEISNIYPWITIIENN